MMNTHFFTYKEINKVYLVLVVLLSLMAGVFSTLPPAYLPLIVIIIGLMLFIPLSVERIFLFIACSIFIDISFISLNGSYLRVYQILFLTLFLKYIFEFLLLKRQISKVPLFLLSNLWVFSYFLAYPHILSVNDFWSVVVGQLFLNIFYFFSVQCIRSNGLPFFLKVLKYTILSGFLVSSLGILQWMGFFVGLNFGISHYESIGVPRPSSFAHEPDWYGLFAAYTAIWFVALYLRKNTSLFSKEFVYLGVFVSFIAVFISMTRAAIIATIISLLIIFFMTKNLRTIKLAVLSTALLLPLVLMLFVVNQEIFMKVYNRFNPATSFETDLGATDSRQASIELMLDYIPKHPIVGNGSGGMALLSEMEEIRNKYIGGGEMNAGRGNANIFLGIMFDTGLVGLLIFILLMGRIGWMLKNTFERTDFVSIGLIGTTLMLLIDFNFNNGLRMGFVWLHFALITSYFLIKNSGKLE